MNVMFVTYNAHDAQYNVVNKADFDAKLYVAYNHFKKEGWVVEEGYDTCNHIHYNIPQQQLPCQIDEVVCIFANV